MFKLAEQYLDTKEDAVLLSKIAALVAEHLPTRDELHERMMPQGIAPAFGWQTPPTAPEESDSETQTEPEAKPAPKTVVKKASKKESEESAGDPDGDIGDEAVRKALADVLEKGGKPLGEQVFQAFDLTEMKVSSVPQEVRAAFIDKCLELTA